LPSRVFNNICVSVVADFDGRYFCAVLQVTDANVPTPQVSDL